MRWRPEWIKIIPLCVCVLQWQHAAAASLAFSMDNDFFLGMDSHYTNGLRLGWLSDERQDSNSGCAFETGLCALPGIAGAQHKQAWSLALQQMMITPEDITQSQPNYNDLPYLGFTHLDMGFYGWNATTLTGYGASIGIIGRHSGAGEAQEFVHRVIGSKQPRGWHNQLGPALVGGVHAFQSRQLLHRSLGEGYAWAIHGAYGIDINNFQGALRSGLFVSYGCHMALRFIPDFTGLSSSAAMIGSAAPANAHGWSLFAGLLGEYDGYSYMHEHAPDEYDLDMRPWLANVLLGASRRWSKLQLIFTLRTSNSILINGSAPLSFGNLTLLWQLP